MLSPRLTILLIFALHGLGIGTLFSRIADIQLDLNLTEAALGTALIGVPVGVLVGAQVVSNLIERLGTRRLLLVGFSASAFTPLLAAIAIGPATLFAALCCFGLTLATCNITMNVEADRVEAASTTRILNRSHGMWGVGFLVATLAGSGMVYMDVPPIWHFATYMIVTLSITATLVAGMIASAPRGTTRRSSRFAVPNKSVLLILGFLASGVILEGASRNWSVIYLRDVTGARDDIATLALSGFIAAQTFGRFLADSWIDRFGPVKVASGLALVALTGLLIVVAGLNPTTAIAGFALIGFGVATSHPQAISAAARLHGDRPSSENVASLTTITTFINFLSPPLFGIVASTYGIQASFALALPLPFLAIFMSRYLLPEKTL